jgi:hypothetical protein
MMLSRKLLSLLTVSNRSISVSACKHVDVPSSKPLSEERQAEMDQKKKELEWRQKPYERPDQWYSNLKLLSDDDKEPVKETYVVRLAKPVDLRPSGEFH